MKKKKLTKEDVKGPDAFISLADKVGKILADNIKAILVTLGLVLALGVGVVTKRQLDIAAEKSAQADIYAVERKIEKIQRDFEELRSEAEAKRLEAATKAAKNELPPPVNKTLDFDQEIAPLAGQLEQAIQRHKGTKSAAIAKLNLAGLYLEHQKYVATKNLLNPLIGSLDPDSSLYGLVRTQLASALSYLGEIDQSLNLLQEILNHASLSYLHGEALIKMGILYQQKKDYDRARNMYRKAETEFGDTESGKSAKKYLRLLNLMNPVTSAKSASTSSDQLNVDAE